MKEFLIGKNGMCPKCEHMGPAHIQYRACDYSDAVVETAKRERMEVSCGRCSYTIKIFLEAAAQSEA